MSKVTPIYKHKMDLIKEALVGVGVGVAEEAGKAVRKVQPIKTTKKVVGVGGAVASDKVPEKIKRMLENKPRKYTKTEGGTFPTYKKDSSKAEEFRQAFSDADKAGKDSFKWDGREYSTEKKSSLQKEGETNMSKFTIRELAEQSVAIQNHAFNDELDKLAAKGTVFKKIVNTIKGLGTKAKSLGKKLDQKAQQLGKTVGGKTGLGTKTKGKGKKAKKTMSTKSKRAVGYGTVGAGILGAAGLKELLD